MYCISFCKCVRAYVFQSIIRTYSYTHTIYVYIIKIAFHLVVFFFIAQKGRLSLILLSNTLNFYSTKLNHTISRCAKHFLCEIYLVKWKIFLSRRFTLFLFCVNWLNFFVTNFNTELFLMTTMARLTKWPQNPMDVFGRGRETNRPKAISAL